MMHSKGVRNSYLYISVLFSALTMFSCLDEVKMSPSTDPPPRGKDNKGIYISGTGKDTNGGVVATYWKNGVPTNLFATYPDAVVYNSSGFGMTISGNDIYVCGILYTSKGNYPIFWKNGHPTVLGPGNGEATAISVIGNVVYVSGIVSDDNGFNYGVVWKNGVISYLTEGEIYSSATTLVVSGQNVYVGGYLVQDGKTFAAYWKNGTVRLLTSGDNFANVQSLAIAGSTVYAAGIELGNDAGKYWKNGEVVNLTDGSVKVMVSALYTSGSNVFAAGKRQTGEMWEMVVWKNGNIVNATPMTAFDIQIQNIISTHSDVLVTGTVIFRNENSSIYTDATLWTNGEPETLPMGSDGLNGYFANSIAVKH
jgi:hypothetical protein